MNITCRLHLNDGTIVEDPQEIEDLVRKYVAKRRSAEDVKRLLKTARVTLHDIYELPFPTLGVLEITDPISRVFGSSNICIEEEPELSYWATPDYQSHIDGTYEKRGFEVYIVDAEPITLGIFVSTAETHGIDDLLCKIDYKLNSTALIPKERDRLKAKRAVLLEKLKAEILASFARF